MKNSFIYFILIFFIIIPFQNFHKNKIHLIQFNSSNILSNNISNQINLNTKFNKEDFISFVINSDLQTKEFLDAFALDNEKRELVNTTRSVISKIKIMHDIIFQGLESKDKIEDIEKRIYTQKEPYEYYDINRMNIRYGVLIKDVNDDETYFMDVILLGKNKRIFFNRNKYWITDIPNFENQNIFVQNFIYQQILDREKENNNKPFIVGMGGCSGTGKSTFADSIKTQLEKSNKKVLVISIDDFLKSSEDRRKLIDDAKKANVDLNEKNNIRWNDLLKFLKKIKSGNKKIKYNKYVRFPKKEIKEVEINLDGVDVLIFEGVYSIVSDNELGNLMQYIDFPIYLDANPMYIRKWRWEQELQTRRVTERRTRGELEEAWNLTLKDLKRNIYPSLNNAKFIIYIDINHGMKIFNDIIFKLINNFDISLQDRICNAV
jgi:uridine kinase